MKRKQRRGGAGMLIRHLSVLLAGFLLIRGAYALDLESAAGLYLDTVLARQDVTHALLGLELGPQPAEDTTPALALLLRESSLFQLPNTKSVSPPPETPAGTPSPAASAPPAPSPVETPAPDTPQPTPAGDPPAISPSSAGINIKNRTEYDIDPEALLSAGLALRLDLQAGTPQVLIIHTHSSEAYMPDGDDIYEESDPSRTEDKRFNVIRVGDELAAALEARGIPVLHDRELYDYPSYTGAYSRSMAAIEGHLAENPSIRIVIDLHRDAFMDDKGNIYKTVAEVGGETCAQVMMVLGTNFSGLDHPNWQENLKLALHLQSAVNQKYPGLTRPLTISQYRYNQHATTGSFILEVGCNGNTLQEALAAVRYFADAAGDVLLNLAPGGAFDTP